MSARSEDVLADPRNDAWHAIAGSGGGAHQGGGAELEARIREMPARRAADLLFVEGWPPMFGVFGQWVAHDSPPLVRSQIHDWLQSVLTPGQREHFEQMSDIDFALATESAGRFRINAHVQRGGPAVAIRAIPEKVPTLAALRLPPDASRLAEFPHGLVLVTGGTGNGKSTTLAALIARLNAMRACHIITLEDPVEFGFPRGKAIIEQREVGHDTPSFAVALRHVVRQRPNVILIGEMRDLETISIALTAAETGHLVLASLHTCNTTQALARIIDVFPAAQQLQVRTQLAASLRAVLGQVLVPTMSDAPGRQESLHPALVPAVELLFPNDAVRRAIRDNETHLIYGMIETGRQAGMRTLEQSLAELVNAGQAEIDVARAAASYPDRFDRLIR